MGISEDATLTLTMQAIDDASATLNALRSTIESTGHSTATMNDSSSSSAAKATAATGLLAGALKGAATAGEFVGKAFQVIRDIGGGAALVLDDMFLKVTDSAVKYAEDVERVSFVTGLTTQKSSGLISAFRAQGMSTEEAASTLQRLEMRLGSFGVSAGKSAAEAEKLEREIKKGGKTGKEAKIKLEELDNQTGGMVSNMRQLGLSYADVTGKGRSMDVLLPSIIDHLRNMTDPMERARVAAQLFGRNYGAIAPLIEAGGAAFLKAEGDAKRFGNSLSQDQVNALHAFKSAQEQAREAVDGFTGDMAMTALPILKTFQTAIQNLGTWYQSLDAHTRGVAQTTLGLAAVFGTLIGGVSALNMAVSTFARFLPIIGTALPAVAGAISAILGPVLLVIAAIVALKLAYDNITPVHRALQPLVDAMGKAFQTFKGALDAAMSVFRATKDPLDALYAGLVKLGAPSQTVSQWASYLRQAWDYMTTSVKPLATILQQSLSYALIQLQPIMRELQIAFVQLRPVMDVLGPVFAAMGAAALILLGGAFKAFVAFLATAIPTAIQVAVDVIRVLVFTFKFLADIVKNVAAIIMDIVHGDFNQAFLDLQKLFFQMGEDIMFIVGSLVATVIDLFFGLIVTVAATVWGFVKGIIDTFMWLYDQLVGHSIIPDMINGIIRWFESLPSRVLGVITTLARNMLGAAASIGANIVQGIVNGLWNLDSAMTHAIGRAINNVPVIGSQVDDALGLPHYATGGWVNAPLGAPQLAVVHGGEFVQSRAMLAAGVSGGGSRGGNGGDVVVNVILDGKVIQRQIMKGGANDFRLRGGLLGSNA